MTADADRPSTPETPLHATLGAPQPQPGAQDPHGPHDASDGHTADPAPAPRLRRPGSPWRLSASHWAGRAPGEREGGYDVSHHITNDPRHTAPDSEHLRTHLIEGTEFDELAVGSWLHVEQMNTSTWWVNLGGVTVHVTADRDGRPRDVWVAGPGDYDDPREGCTYRLTWGRHVEDGETPAAPGLRQAIAAALREHGMVHLADEMPADEYDCCADAVMAVVQPHLGQKAARPIVNHTYEGAGSGHPCVADGYGAVCGGQREDHALDDQPTTEETPGPLA